MTIALPPGITVFERGWLSANNILFQGPEGNALVDSGYATHAEQTVGMQWASRMNAAGTARRLGMDFAMHSDAPITPIHPLFTAWCAVQRETASGRVLGEAERLSVDDALHAITMGAARTLKLEQRVGSIEPGKLADFAVLEDDPRAVAPAALKDVKVWGTVLGGRIFPAPGSAP